MKSQTKLYKKIAAIMVKKINIRWDDNPSDRENRDYT